MKRIIKTFACFIISITIFGGAVVAQAASTPPYVYDEAGLLNKSTVSNLVAKAAQIKKDTGLTVAIVTLNELNGYTPARYASNYYTSNFDNNGVLFLISMAERDWWIEINGTSSNLLTESRLDAIEDEMIPMLSNGNYDKAMTLFVDKVDKYYTTDPSKDINWEELLVVLGVIGGISLLFAGAYVYSLVKSMNNAVPNNYAHAYGIDNSFILRDKRDIYLYNKVTKTQRQQSSSRSGGGGGGGGSSRGGKF